MNQEKSEYEIQAEKFLEETGTTMEIKFLKYDKPFDDDKDKRDIYEVTLKRGNREFKFNFGNSIASSGKFIQWSKNGKVLLHTEKEASIARTLHHDQVEKNKDFKEPSAYSILACLTKSEPGSFEDFCGDFGYDTDSRKAEKVYHAVKNEWDNIKMLFSDEEIERLGEIQ